jgi:hypothetical protein
LEVAVSKKKRFEVFKRDKFVCQYCGQSPPDVILECDHIAPRCEGGSDDYSNLITSCFDCNRGKSGNLLGDSDCNRVQELQLEQIAQLAAFNRMLIASEETLKDQQAWLAKTVAENMDWIDLDDHEKKSLALFARKLTITEIVEASQKAGSKRISGNSARWRYFCGVCWGRIKDNGESL